MRVLAAALVLASSMLTGAGWLWPVAAQDVAQAANPHNLPGSNLGNDTAPAGHGFGPAAGFASASAPINPQAPDAKPIGQATCVACHSGEADNFAHTTHAMGMQVAAAADPMAATCEGCHGPGSAHAASPSTNGSIISFRKGAETAIATQTGTCLACHSGGPRDAWLGSVHQRNQLSCSDCHNPMAAFSVQGLNTRQSASETCATCHKDVRQQFNRRSHMPLAEGQIGCTDCHNPMAAFSVQGLNTRQSASETCATCHKDIRQQFNRRSHMPLAEGQIGCTDCHNPHGTINANLLKTDTVNDTCYQCHAEKRGPFLWEHAPVRENCVTCHSPHGSNQQALLVAPIPMLCQQCHANTRHPGNLMTGQNLGNGGAPDERIMARGCINCHSQVHGSNHPSGTRMHN